MKAAVAVLALLGPAACTSVTWMSAAAAAPAPRVVTCAGFMEAFTKAAVGHRISFDRPLNITRGFFGDEAGLDVRILNDGEDVDGTLKCKGDAFRRFEVRVAIPVSDKVLGAFKDLQEAALAAAFGWDRAKVQTIATAMSSDADEYMRASIQRGDTYISGKVEYHQGDALDLGVVWTQEDRMMVITTQDQG